MAGQNHEIFEDARGRMIFRDFFATVFPRPTYNQVVNIGVKAINAENRRKMRK